MLSPIQKRRIPSVDDLWKKAYFPAYFTVFKTAKSAYLESKKVMNTLSINNSEKLPYDGIADWLDGPTQKYGSSDV